MTFRKLARKKQQLSDAECIEILKNEKRGVLSVLGDEGYPYGMPMNHYYDEADGRIYFHCGRSGHRLDALRRCDKVSFCVCDGGVQKEGNWSLDFRSVIVFGKMEIIDDQAQVCAVARQLCYKFTQDEAYIQGELDRFAANTLLLALKPEQICGKRVNEA